MRADPKAYSLRPRLWLLAATIIFGQVSMASASQNLENGSIDFLESFMMQIVLSQSLIKIDLLKPFLNLSIKKAQRAKSKVRKTIVRLITTQTS